MRIFHASCQESGIYLRVINVKRNLDAYERNTNDKKWFELYSAMNVLSQYIRSSASLWMLNILLSRSSGKIISKMNDDKKNQYRNDLEKYVYMNEIKENLSRVTSCLALWIITYINLWNSNLRDISSLCLSGGYCNLSSI